MLSASRDQSLYRRAADNLFKQRDSFGLGWRISDTDFRHFVPTPGRDPETTARAYTDVRMQGERPQSLFGNWRRLFAEPSRGLTTDGSPQAELFGLQDDGAPTAEVIAAVDALMARLSPDPNPTCIFRRIRPVAQLAEHGTIGGEPRPAAGRTAVGN